VNNKQLAEILKKHVYILSSQIGDRNVFNYENLKKAAFYISEKFIYAKQAKKNKEKIKAVIILEMVGYYTDAPHSQSFPPFLNLFYPHQGNFICIVGNYKSKNLARKIYQSFKKTSFPAQIFIGSSIVVGVDFSDHWSFWKEGFPAVMLTDTAFYRNPYYHTEEDTYEKLNYKKLREFFLALEKVLVDLDKQEI